MNKIHSLQELKELASTNKGVYCTIKSETINTTKSISYSTKNGWEIYDNTRESLTICIDDNQLKNRTNILRYIEEGSMFIHD